jgi:hypothetical protein
VVLWSTKVLDTETTSLNPAQGHRRMSVILFCCPMRTKTFCWTDRSLGSPIKCLKKFLLWKLISNWKYVNSWRIITTRVITFTAIYFTQWLYSFIIVVNFNLSSLAFPCQDAWIHVPMDLILTAGNLNICKHLGTISLKALSHLPSVEGIH